MEESLLLAAYNRGRRPPKPIQDAPDLLPGLDFYLRAFYELSTCRPIGYGAVGSIPWTAIVQYGHLKGMDGEALEDLVFLVRELDAEYLGWQSEEAKK
jgi:hypothetical protein